MEKGKRWLRGILMLAVILWMLPAAVKAEGAERTPTRVGTLGLTTEAAKNEEEGWEWQPEAAGGGTLILTDCYIQSDKSRMISFENIAEGGETITIVLKGDNIIEHTGSVYSSMITFNSYNSNTVADVIIREEGKGSLEVRTSEPVASGQAPYGFCCDSLKIESGSLSSNIEFCLLTSEFLMEGGSLVIRRPENIDNSFGICSVMGPVNIKGGTVDITAGHIGIIISGVKGDGWNVNISGGDVSIKARQSCIQMQKPSNAEGHRIINITGGSFYGESDITGLFADDINIVKEGESAPQVMINSPGDAQNPNIKAIHAIKGLTVSDSIVMADTIYNYDTSQKENSMIFQGKTGQVYGEVTLDSDFTIPSGGTLAIPRDAVLTISENGRLIVDGTLVNDGILVLPEKYNDISCSGTGLIKRGEEIYSNEFIKLYSVTIETADGEVTKYYKEGECVELTPETAPKGKRFKEWKITPDTVAVTDNQFLMPDSAVTVIPVYEDISYEIKVSASPKEGGTVTGGGNVKEGESVTVSAAANSGYVFAGWSEDGQEISTDAAYTFTASADRTLTACFEKEPEDISYEIKVSASPKEGGTVTGGGNVKEGESVTVSAAANSGYVFAGWSEDGQEVSTDAAYTFTVSADRTLTACFKKKIPDTPEKVIQVENTVKTVAEVVLPAGWSFEEASAQKNLPAGGSVTVTARYTAEDYDTVSVEVTIKRDACEEASGVVYSGTGEQAPNCTQEGIGHTECKLCGDIVRKDIRVPAGHTAGETVVTKAAPDRDGSITSYCRVCNAAIKQTVIDGIGESGLHQAASVYTGKTQTPSVTVKDRKGKELKQDADYVVVYPKDMKNVGIYSVKVTFMGNYEGTADLGYTITPKGTSISKIKAKKKGFSLKWKKQASQTTGYEIQYSVNKRFTKKTTKTLTVKKNKTTSKSVTKQKANKKYYVRIRTYKTVRVNGKNIKLTSGWSKVKTVRTKK